MVQVMLFAVLLTEDKIVSVFVVNMISYITVFEIIR